jgi:hypothetical protein
MSKPPKGFKSKGYTVKWQDPFSHYVIRDCQGRFLTVTDTTDEAKDFIAQLAPSTH